VLLIPVVFGGLLFVSQIDEIEADVLSTNLSNIELSRTVIESTIRNVDTLIDSVRDDRRIDTLSFLPFPLEGPEVPLILTAHRESVLPRIDDPHILDLVLYFADSRILLNRDTVFLNTEFFYPIFFSEPGVGHDAWIDDMSNPAPVRGAYRQSTIELDGIPRDVVVIRYSMPLYPRSEAKGTMIALLDRSRIESLISRMVIGEQGFAFILDPTGNVVAGSGAVPDDLVELLDSAANLTQRLPDDLGVTYERVRGTRWAVVYARSSYNDWLYVVGSPVSLFFQQARRVQFVFGLIAIAAILIGAPVAVVLAVRSSRPIAEIDRVLANGVLLSGISSRDPLRRLSESVSDLVDRHQGLSRLLEEQRPMIKRVVVERLFRGDFGGEEETRSYVRQFAPDIEAPRYAVGCVQIDSYYEEMTEEILQEFHIKNSLVRHQISASFPPRSLVHELGPGRIGVIVPIRGDGPDPGDYEDWARGATPSVDDPQYIRCMFSRPVTVATFSQIPEALSIAAVQIDAMPASSAGDPVADDSQAAVDSFYYYTAETEMRLINLASRGKTDEVGAILDLVRIENFERRDLSVQALRAFAQELAGTKMKVARRLSRDIQASTPMADHHDGLGLESYVLALMEDLKVLSRKAQGTDLLEARYARLIQYVDGHYRNPKMSLKLLSTEFKLSEVYISHLFRQIAGTNFATYVEKLRLNEAMRRLSTSNDTIDTVAAEVGYGSTRAFRGAFKRVHGLTPSSVRTA
jgi:AraC-like DNA-binding protein